ncbi:hypothetical protein AVEN_149562-1 [Araneus ventricosus]|uniref:CCHC-type domain-containing protein n=1 Tax=Araneus ventricosus TaxID=182803 RepID=A0A4Y2KES4_ARAVE|nr:hypothetical protein AVEN_231750-1 [Araneus ventricosus]GBN01302.1 hypothetical protein AVEN_149562-1 [Araneus ventricosus]
MAFLAKHRKEELIALAEDMGIEISPTDKKIDLCKKIKESPDFEEEFVRGCLEDIVKQREAEAAELKTQREAEALREEREFELEKIRLSNAAEINSVGSARSESVRPRRELRNLMQKYDAQVADISLYLAMFERQARTAEIEESEWVSQLMALLPLDLAQIIIKEPEDKMKDYLHIKGVLLERFKMKPETFRVKFTQHQRKSGELWKELIFELRNYLEGWLDGIKVNDFETLKNLMITDQVKRRVSPEVKDHFLDEWGKIVDPSELAGKLDEYESVRSARKQHFPKALERKPTENIKPVSPKRELKGKPLGNSGPQFWKNSTPKGNWRNENFERRKPAACYICHSTEHLRPNCPQLKKYQPVEVVNHVGMSDSTETLFAPYMSKALVNQTEMSILRDTGASIDLSPELGKIVTKAVVLDAHLDNDIYLLGNRSAQLIEEQRKTSNSNVVVTRGQKLKKETEASAVIKPPPQRPVQNENPIIVGEELVPLPLPQAEGDTLSLLKVSSETFASKQNNCTSLNSSWEKEKAEKSKINNGLNSDISVKETQTENSNDIVSKSVTLNVESIPREINDEIKNDFYQKGEFSGKKIIAMIGIELDEADCSEIQGNLVNATTNTSHEVDFFLNKLPDQNELGFEIGAERLDRYELHCNGNCMLPRSHERKKTELKGTCLVLKAIRGKHEPPGFNIHGLLPFDARKRPPGYLMFEVDMRLLYEHCLDPGEESNPVNLKEIWIN